MEEADITIPGAGVSLEGRFAAGSAGGAVIAHPHPLYGGSLDNNVVWTAARALQARGLATLRFNFRGVGDSTGVYGEGRAETEDVAAALDFLKTRAPGPHYLVGYSFGAYVVARALMGGLEAQGAILISPPIAFMDLAFLPETPRLCLIVAGDHDDLCPLDALKALLAETPHPPEIAVVVGADHFYGGREEKLFYLLRDQPWPARCP